MFSLFKSKPSGSGSVSKLAALDKLDENCLPVLSSDQLIKLLAQDNCISRIKRLTGIGADHFDSLYMPVINAFIVRAQLVPASISHHHSGLGGLIVHTLEVIERALRVRKNYDLPQNSDPETIAAQQHVWTYGVFIGAILHDAAKLITNYSLVLNNGAAWNALGTDISKTGAASYKITFLKSDYSLHSKMAALFFAIIPERGRQWLSSYNKLLAQLSAYLQHDPYESGVIGEIVTEADGFSVAENIKAGGDRKQLKNAPAIPLVNRLVTALRQILESGDIRLNTSGGSAGWVEGHHTYLVSKVIADKIISYMKASGASDIPSDNSRIFDILQEHGFAIPTDDGKAVWSMIIGGKIMENGKPEFKYELTMLKFETNRLFHPSRRPKPFDGVITVNCKYSVAKIDNSADDNKSGAAVKTDDPETVDISQAKPQQDEIIKAETDTYSYDSGAVVTTDWDDDDPFAMKTEPVSTAAEGQQANGCASSDSSKQTTATVAGSKADVVDNNSTESDAGFKPIEGLFSAEIGTHFMDWIRKSVAAKRLPINKPNARIHIVPEGVLLVSPAIFKQYLNEFDLADMNGDNKTIIMEAVKRVQNKVQKLKLNIRTEGSMKLNIHNYRIAGDNKNSNIKAMLFPLGEIFKDITKAPEPNKFLSSKDKKPEDDEADEEA
ncbi:MAG: hypothetical protein D6B27_04040 [Gammaproteobacteria bacterium]|nr:MAG: hypothetical protein D6B27_04040 [Gammaproteobacteria bacterium]